MWAVKVCIVKALKDGLKQFAQGHNDVFRGELCSWKLKLKCQISFVGIIFLELFNLK